MSRRIITVTAAAVAAAAVAVAAPTASAVPDYPASSSGPVPERTTEPAAVSSSRPVAPVPERTTEPETLPVAGPTVVVETADEPAFDWASAAIGAGVALAVLLFGLAAAATTSRHGRLRPSH
jgi:hypothetical protein